MEKSYPADRYGTTQDNDNDIDNDKVTAKVNDNSKGRTVCATATAPATAPAGLNKREEANDKMNERHLIGQCVQNPFLARNDYTKDIEMQGNYLRPRNTSTTKSSTPTVLASSMHTTT
jgi:hypothetical protein